MSRNRIGRPKLGHKWRPFDDARSWVQQQHIPDFDAWQAFCRSGRLPADIPTVPNRTYKSEWKDFRHWLGGGRSFRETNRFWPFEKARSFVRQLGLKGQSDWKEFLKSASRPWELPTAPERQYQAEWKSWGDFLGTDVVATYLRKYETFEAVRYWAQNQGFKSRTDWNNYSKSKKLPDNIPATPDRHYPEWISWGDFLGTGYVAVQLRSYRPFSEARNWAHLQQLDGTQAWKAMVAAGLLPPDIPSNANRIYAEWQGWEDFLGVPRMARRSKIEIRLAHELAEVLPIDLKNRRVHVSEKQVLHVDICSPTLRLVIEYDGAYYHKNSEDRDRRNTKLLKSAGWAVVRLREYPLEKLDSNDLVLPAQSSVFSNVVQIISHLSSLGYADDLAVIKYRTAGKALAGESANKSIRSVFRSYSDAKTWALSAGLKSHTAWRVLVRNNGLPTDIPADPYSAYETEWNNWGEFLGTGNLAPSQFEWRGFREARDWARSLDLHSRVAWQDLVKTSKRPTDIPSHPERAYRNEWMGWADWLNIKSIKNASRRPIDMVRRLNIHNQKTSDS